MQTTPGEMEEYDLIILGSGEGGKYLAWNLAKERQKVAVVERKYVGGSCPNIACLPSKNVIRSAKVASLFQRSQEFGITVTGYSISAQGVRQRKRQMVSDLVDIHWKNYTQTGAQLILGQATFTGPRTVSVVLNDGTTRTLHGTNVVIGTGTTAIIPAIPGLAESHPWTHIEMLELDRIPEHLIVLGGGYIGLEFAQAALRLGSKVTVIDRNARLLPREDPDISEALQILLQREGADLRLNATGEKVTGQNGESVELQLCSAGQTETLTGTHILAATGRRPNTGELRVDLAGVELTPQGYIKVNERLQTTANGVWAIGEVAGSPQFTHISYDDFRVIRENLAGRNRVTTGRQVPYVLFTDPEVAHIGLSENEAKKQGTQYRLFKVPMAAVLRTRTLGETEGFLKALVDDHDQIIGFTAFGVDVGEVMSMVQIAMLGKMPYTMIRDAVLTHPTLAEGLVVLFSSTPGSAGGAH